MQDDVLENQLHPLTSHTGALNLKPQVRCGDLYEGMLGLITALHCQLLNVVIDEVLLDHEQRVVPVRVEDDLGDCFVHLDDALDVFEVTTEDA